MFQRKSQLSVHVALLTAVILLGACASTTSQDKQPVEVGKTQYKGQVVPVYDGHSVKSDKSTPPVYPPSERRTGIEGVGVVMIIIDETGTPVEFQVVSSTPTPEFGAAALAAAENWHYFPLVGSTGRPILYALRIPINFRLSEN